jgi:hypothetical protein
MEEPLKNLLASIDSFDSPSLGLLFSHKYTKKAAQSGYLKGSDRNIYHALATRYSTTLLPVIYFSEFSKYRDNKAEATRSVFPFTSQDYKWRAGTGTKPTHPWQKDIPFYVYGDGKVLYENSFDSISFTGNSSDNAMMQEEILYFQMAVIVEKDVLPKTNKIIM